MRIPYSCITTHGDIVFAARSGQIQTFKLSGGPALTTWNHPEAEREATASLSSASAIVEESPQTEDEPPAKRQRVEEATPAESTPETGATTAQEGDEEGAVKGGRGKKAQRHGQRGPISRQPDYHLVIILEVSADGKHVVAVSGNDKTIWVFAHDGNGGLVESSKR